MITVNKAILAKALNTAAKAVGANPVFPLLSNLMFRSNNGKSRVAGTNLEIGIGYTFASSGDPFVTCVPAKTFTSLVDTLSTEEVDLELDPKNQSLIVMTESSTSNIRCAPADEFPDIPEVKKKSFVVPVGQFKEMVGRVAFAASNTVDSNLSAVQISIQDGKLIMFAVDGYHFSYEEFTLEPKKGGKKYEQAPFLVKGVTLEVISRTLPDEGDLSVEVQENKAMFHCAEVDIVTQLMNGDFPDYKRLKASIAPAKTKLTVGTLELIRSARQVRVFAADTGATKLEIKGMLVRLSTTIQEKGDADVSFSAVRKGEDITVGINVHLLYELLEVCKTEFLIVELTDKSSPIVFKMKGVDTFYHIIMPLTI